MARAADDGRPDGDPVATIPALLARAAARHPDADAVVEAAAAGGARRTWAQLAADVGDVARGCIAAGVAPGDAVAVWAPNSLPWVVAALGALAAGGRVVPLSTRSPAAEVVPLLSRSRARLVVVASTPGGPDPVAELSQAARTRAEPSGRSVAGPPSRGPLGGGRPDPERPRDPRSVGAGPVPGLVDLVAVVDAGAGVATASGARTLADLVAAGRSVPPAEVAARSGAVRGDDVSHVQFTSGTTGEPKGVLLRHAAMTSTTASWCAAAGLRGDDRYLVVSPCSHLAGHKTGLLACLTVGAAMLPRASFDPAAVLAAIEHERVTVLQGPPTMFQALLDHPDRPARDLSSVRLVVTGAATVPVSLVHRLRDELGRPTVLTAYGLTEASGVCTICRSTDPPEVVADTSGRPIAGVEVLVLDEHGEPVPVGVEGDVLVRTDGLMAGYLDDPEATAAVVGADGWLRTGDIGRVDADGNLTVTGRRKDLVIVGGFNVSPSEVEEVLLGHPAVVAAAVVAGPDARMGEVPVGFVVAAPGAPPEVADLVAWCGDRLAGYKVPRRIELVDSLPVNTSGKVRKDLLRDRLRDDAEAGGSVVAPPPAAPVPVVAPSPS